MGNPNARRVEFDNDGNPICGTGPTLFESTDAYNAIIESYKIMSRYSFEHTGHVYLPSEYAFQHTDMVFDEVTRTFTQSPKAPYTSFEFFINNELFSVDTPQSVTIQDTTGLWFIYYDENGVLQSSLTPWDWGNKQVFTAIVYWDSSDQKAVIFGEERHGLSMPWATHKRLHRIENTRIESGGLEVINVITDGDGSLDAHAQIGVTDGFIHDEDIVIPIRHAATPTESFEQVLNPMLYAGILHLENTNTWHRAPSTEFPLYENPPSLPYFNFYNGTTWGLQEVQDGYYFATWLVYTNDIRHPVMALIGQREDDNLISAINNNTRKSLSLPGLPSTEFVFYRKLIWEASSSFTNTPKAALRYVAEASEINPSNDRYPIKFWYTGNANKGKILETFPGTDSFESPFIVPETSYLRSIIVNSTSNSTGTIGIFFKSAPTVPVFNIALQNQSTYEIDLTLILPDGEAVFLEVTNGNTNKPTVTLYIQTSL